MQHRTGPHREHQRLGGARARTPGDAVAHPRPGGVVIGAEGAHQIEDLFEYRLAHRHAAQQFLCGDQFLGGENRCAASSDPVVASRMSRSVPRSGIIHVDLHQEPVELCFGQGIGAFLLDRVLRGENMKGRGQGAILAGHCDLTFLHRLQKGRLGAGTSAVDLVGHQKLAEDRTRE